MSKPVEHTPPSGLWVVCSCAVFAPRGCVHALARQQTRSADTHTRSTHTRAAHKAGTLPPPTVPLTWRRKHVVLAVQQRVLCRPCWALLRQRAQKVAVHVRVALLVVQRAHAVRVGQRGHGPPRAAQPRRRCCPLRRRRVEACGDRQDGGVGWGKACAPCGGQVSRVWPRDKGHGERPRLAGGRVGARQTPHARRPHAAR